MEREEIIFSVESSKGEKLYKNSFKIPFYFTKDKEIYEIGQHILDDMENSQNIVYSRIDSGKKDLNNSLKNFFKSEKEIALIRKQKPFYNWDDDLGRKLGSLAGMGVAIYSYFTFGADCATDTATYLNDISKNLAFLTGIVQTGISFTIPLCAGGFSYLSSSKTINFIGKKYFSLKNKFSQKAKNHGEKLKNDIELYGKLERAVVE